jgi:sodium-dependent dicarboxylate transporter 2/3/5
MSLHAEPVPPMSVTPAELEPRRWVRRAAPAVALGVAGAFLLAIDDPMHARAAAIAAACLVLWLTEAVPLYATTLLLWVGMVAALGPLDPKAFSLQPVLSTSANPVMALFFGGFALSVAGSKYGIDAYLAEWIVRLSGGSRLRLLLLVAAGAAILSMWMSNIAAAAMMIATLRPLFTAAGEGPGGAGFRKALLLGVAFAANFGGIATPIGTGPNLIAIGAVAPMRTITFLQWMSFGVPLAVVMVAFASGLLAWRYRVAGRLDHVPPPATDLTRKGWAVVAIFFVAVTGWLTEPLHGVSTALVALAVAGALFAGGLLDRRDLAKLEWDTLLLVAGGLALGELFHSSGLAASLAHSTDLSALPHPVFLLALTFGCGLISAVASNTAAAAMLIQIALGLIPQPSVAIVVALGASMGVPFVISTPPNSMAYGQGGLRSGDFIVPGVVLMLGGCAVVAFAVPPVLQWMGIP